VTPIRAAVLFWMGRYNALSGRWREPGVAGRRGAAGTHVPGGPAAASTPHSLRWPDSPAATPPTAQGGERSTGGHAKHQAASIF